MTSLEKKRLVDLCEQLLHKVSILNKQSAKMNERIKKYGQSSDAEWNDMWHTSGMADGIMSAVSEFKDLLQEMKDTKNEK